MMSIDKINEASLIDCVVVVRSKLRSVGGRISYIEGDVFEVMFEVEENIPIPLGNSVGITIYSAEGLIVFDTYPIASYLQRILCILPPDLQKKLLNRRKDIRIPVRYLNSCLESLLPQASSSPYVFEQGLHCDIKNISLGGLLFSIESPIPIQEKDVVRVNLDGKFKLNAIIRHHQKLDTEYRYGAEFMEMSKEDKHTLKSLIINQQATHRPMQIGIEHYLND
ncbi:MULTISPECIES: PilZ domain-containing protein [unclassified Paenibacillus]|uniref:PilZ domain-containing protein n=1 Tax=Paenibacillus provencensis TaxID=441151 RepID=A0ABW3PVK8_9BACL|nr:MULTISPECIES: PilZ domain-containing protein [unclassified Paenibacillus]MCM3129145.1 PilZ domain-containing protein [Paenibacillus sp. MER 78]SFS52391.1 c-di-GMP-binding flagellar brake protein YcgR, contains PilZNR and PilZ domains [Paenibacillus sp. 453mf]